MNKSILVYGTPALTPDEQIDYATAQGLAQIETNWTPSKKFPRVDTLVIVNELPASFKHDRRAVHVESVRSLRPRR